MAKIVTLRKISAPAAVVAHPPTAARTIPDPAPQPLIALQIPAPLPTGERVVAAGMVRERVRFFTAEELELFEERAGICEYDGGLNREHAEQEAFLCVTGARQYEDPFSRAVVDQLGGIEILGIGYETQGRIKNAVV
jgi:hypothetical protein